MAVDARIHAAAEQIASQGLRPILVSIAGVEGFPEILFKTPTLGQLSTYTFQASQPAVGPLLASIGLARQIAVIPSARDLEPIVSSAPYAILRAVQVVLRDLGLGARAEKKSLS
jgi:hypothetical protein